MPPVVRYAVRRLNFATKRVCIFSMMKGPLGASPEMAPAMRLVRRDTIKETHYQPKKFAIFDKRGPPGTSPPETAAAKSPMHHSAVQETQFAANSNSLCVAICRDDVAITLPC